MKNAFFRFPFSLLKVVLGQFRDLPLGDFCLCEVASKGLTKHLLYAVTMMRARSGSHSCLSALPTNQRLDKTLAPLFVDTIVRACIARD